MQVHVLQHVPFEDVGSMAIWLARKGASVSCTRFYEANACLPEELPELLIVMGGPMSVNDEQRFPWLAAEKAYIARAIDSGTAVLGICLGAQLIAASQGANIFQGKEKEIGWLPISPNAELAIGLDNSLFSFPAATVFHWHGETFDLPERAHRLASSAACKNQAFQLGERVIGLQFHLETTPESARLIADNCGDELVPGRYIQTREAILAGADVHGQIINDMMADVLNYLTR